MRALFAIVIAILIFAWGFNLGLHRSPRTTALIEQHSREDLGGQAAVKRPKSTAKPIATPTIAATATPSAQSRLLERLSTELSVKRQLADQTLTRSLNLADELATAQGEVERLQQSVWLSPEARGGQTTIPPNIQQNAARDAEMAMLQQQLEAERVSVQTLSRQLQQQEQSGIAYTNSADMRTDLQRRQQLVAGMAQRLESLRAQASAEASAAQSNAQARQAEQQQIAEFSRQQLEQAQKRLAESQSRYDKAQQEAREAAAAVDDLSTRYRDELSRSPAGAE